MFLKESTNSFKLEPLHYRSTPGYSLDTLRKLTGVILKLISDIEKYQFIENMIRGGNCIISKGHAEGNNKLVQF